MLVDFGIHDLDFNFFAGCVLHYVFVADEEVLLTRSEPVDAETCHHDVPVRSPGNGVPGGLGVTPPACGNHFESEEDMHVSLALEAKQLIAIDNVLLVKLIRIRQTFLFMIEVDKVWRHLRYLCYVLQ